MNRFIAEQNIEHFRKLLGTEMTEEKRLCVLGLLAEEEAKLRSIEAEERRTLQSRGKERGL